MSITNKQIKSWNEQFKNLSKPEKRIMVAKDVLKQIKIGKYHPANSGYVLVDYDLNKLDVQKNFDKIQSCSCCMLGNCILSLTKFQNNLTFGDLDEGFQNEDSKVSKMLKSVFTPYQQALLEACFENGGHEHAKNAYYFSLSWEDVEKCQTFYDKYDNPEQRVVAAMKNIIANNGTFKP